MRAVGEALEQVLGCVIGDPHHRPGLRRCTYNAS
jgi:hypothetical protein